MANALYGKGKERFMKGQIDLTTVTVKASLIKNTYPQSLSVDEFYSDISAYVLNTSQTLVGKSVTLGVFDASDIAFTAVTAGDTSEGVVLWVDTGNPATSPLVAYIDTITGFPVATNGGDVAVQWDNGAYKIWAF